MKNDHEPIKWDKAKKEQRDRERDDQEKRKRILQVVARHYEKWKASLKKKPIPKAELIKHLYALRDKVVAEVESIPELKDWKDFTHNLLEDKIAQVISIDITTSNDIEEYVPSFGREEAPDPNDLVLRGDIKKERRFKFTTWEEFTALPLIRGFTTKPDFVGLLRKDIWIMALFMDGVTVPVGKVSNLRGIEKMPTWEAFQEKLKEKPDSN